MKEAIVLDKYIESYYIQLFNNDTPISTYEFNSAFALNKYFNSNTPLLRHGLQDFYFSDPERLEYNYQSSFRDKLIGLDRYAITGRVALYSLMRVMMPSFKLVLNENKEVAVDAFLSIHENGYCSVTYIYNVGENALNKELFQQLTYWNDIVGIKINKNIWDLLKLNHNDVPDDFEEILLSVQTFFTAINDDNKFGFMIEIMQKILSESNQELLKTFRLEKYIHLYRYYQFMPNKNLKDEELDKKRIIIEEKDDKHVYNTLMDETLTNLTVHSDYTVLICKSYVLSFSTKSDSRNIDFLAPYFMEIDYFLVERCKATFAIRKFKKLKNTNKPSLGELLNLKENLIDNLNEDLLNDFGTAKEDISASTIKRCLNVEAYNKELEMIYKKLEAIISTSERLSEDKKNNSFNKKIQIITMILAIPTVSTIVDIFYSIPTKTPEIISIAWSKLICIIIALILTFFVVKNKTK